MFIESWSCTCHVYTRYIDCLYMYEHKHACNFIPDSVYTLSAYGRDLNLWLSFEYTCLYYVYTLQITGCTLYIHVCTCFISVRSHSLTSPTGSPTESPTESPSPAETTLFSHSMYIVCTYIAYTLSYCVYTVYVHVSVLHMGTMYYVNAVYQCL